MAKGKKYGDKPAVDKPEEVVTSGDLTAIKKVVKQSDREGAKDRPQLTPKEGTAPAAVIPKKKGSRAALTPVLDPTHVIPTEAQRKAARGNRLPVGRGSRTKPFEVATRPEVHTEPLSTPKNIRGRARRAAHGMGIPGTEEGGHIPHAIQLAKDDQTAADATIIYRDGIHPITRQPERTVINQGKPVNGRLPGDTTPITAETVTGTFHDKIAHVISKGGPEDVDGNPTGFSMEDIHKTLPNTKTPFAKKVEILHNNMLNSKKAKVQVPVDTSQYHSYVDPESGEVRSLSHPDAPKPEEFTVAKGKTRTVVSDPKGETGKRAKAARVGWSEDPKRPGVLKYTGAPRGTSVVSVLAGQASGAITIQNKAERMAHKKASRAIYNAEGEMVAEGSLGIQSQVPVEGPKVRAPRQLHKLANTQSPAEMRKSIVPKVIGEITSTYDYKPAAMPLEAEQHQHSGINTTTGEVATIPYKSTYGMTVTPPSHWAGAKGANVTPEAEQPDVFTDAKSINQLKRFLPNFSNKPKLKKVDTTLTDNSPTSPTLSGLGVPKAPLGHGVSTQMAMYQPTLPGIVETKNPLDKTLITNPDHPDHANYIKEHTTPQKEVRRIMQTTAPIEGGATSSWPKKTAGDIAAANADFDNQAAARAAAPTESVIAPHDATTENFKGDGAVSIGLPKWSAKRKNMPTQIQPMVQDELPGPTGSVRSPQFLRISKFGATVDKGTGKTISELQKTAKQGPVPAQSALTLNKAKTQSNPHGVSVVSEDDVANAGDDAPTRQLQAIQDKAIKSSKKNQK